MRTVTTIAVAAILSTAAPAQADPRPRDRPGHGHDARGGKGTGASAVIAALLIGGLVGALAGKAAATDADTAPAEPDTPLYASDDPDEQAAVHACLASVEDEGYRMAPIVRVARVTTVTTILDRRTVNGRVLLAWQPDEAPLKHIFRCKVGATAVERVSIEPMR